MKKYLLILVYYFFANIAYANDKMPLIKFPTLVVSTNSQSSLTVDDNSQALREINKTAGGVAVVDAKTFENKYSLNLSDTLANVAGVYAQKRFGEEVRIAIRGSGLSRGFHMRGIQLLQDGVAFNLADGSGDFQEADSLSFQRLEVFKGANALKFGGATLGGAINMVSKTGKTNQGNQLRFELGSFDTKRLNMQLGRDFGDLDFFLSLTATHGNGFRQHTRQENLKFNSNFAKKFAKNKETRFYLSANSINQELPGSLSKSNAVNNPKIADNNAILGDHKRDIDSFRFANKTSFVLKNGDKIDFGGFLNVKDLSHPISIFIDQKTIDYGFYSQRAGQYNLKNYSNDYLLGIRTHLGKTHAKVFQNNFGTKGLLSANSQQISQNLQIFGENNFHVSKKLSLITATQLNLNKRQENNLFDPRESDQKIYRSFNPKLGILYKINKDSEIFSNFSRSNEPPTFSELTQSGSIGFTPLKMQKAWTLEMGSRGIYKIVDWDLSLYRSWIKSEMLQYRVVSGIPASTFNAQDTIHQGIELGLNLQIFKNLLKNSDQLKLYNAYTLSDYRFDKDRQYLNNIIAGQPRHFFKSELRYEQASWFIAGNAEVASNAQVDFANTVKTQGYAVFGLNAGYNFDKNFNFFIDCRNLLNKKYLATFSTTTTGAGNVFFPADGRAFYAGLKTKL
ncbi:TonB-dependent receptor [Alphaproteobacteria bacterium]|nr:TonB-dependent receptor [Alphaproteobacteria bacterium]